MTQNNQDEDIIKIVQPQDLNRTGFPSTPKPEYVKESFSVFDDSKKDK